MHFRRRGKNVQIVRSQPADETGKAVSTPIGSANLATGEIKEKAAALTPAETQEVKAWIARHQAIEAQKREVEYRTLADTLSEMVTWMRDADPKLLGEHADEVHKALGRVRKALDKKTGQEKGGQDQGGGIRKRKSAVAA